MSELPRGWVEATVGDTGRYINGFAFKPEHWGDSGRPIIRIQNLTDPDKIPNRTNLQVADDLVVRPGDLLVSWSATLDAFIWLGEEALLNQHIFRVVPDDRIVSRRYLYYLLKQLISEMLKTEHLHGSTMKHINRGPFMAHRAPIAPRAEQERIADEIDKQFTRLDSATAALKRVQANLKRYRASVLKAACEGRLVPTEAELARKEGRDYEPADQLLQRILRERRARWEADTLAKMIASDKPPKDDRWKQKYKEPSLPDTSHLPELPEGWCWTSFDQVAWRVRSGTAETSGRNSTDHPVLKSSAVRPGRIDFGDVNYLRPEQVKEDNYVQKGDLFVTRLSGSLEYVAQCAVVVTEPARPIQYPDRLFCAKLVDCVDRNFVSYTFQHPPLRAAMEKAAKSTAGHQRISMSDLFSFVFPLPPAREQRRIVAALDQQYSFVERLILCAVEDATRAEQLRRAVLLEAFSGTLVRQNPADEPASILLERIRSASTGTGPRGSRRLRRTASELVEVG